MTDFLSKRTVICWAIPLYASTSAAREPAEPTFDHHRSALAQDDVFLADPALTRDSRAVAQPSLLRNAGDSQWDLDQVLILSLSLV